MQFQPVSKLIPALQAAISERPSRRELAGGGTRFSRQGSVEVTRAAAREWLEAREAELLPVQYFHQVFTIPAALGSRRKIQPVLQAHCRRFTLDSAAAIHGSVLCGLRIEPPLAKSRCALSARLA
jgi:hypothetical protein